jgi:hypothetical protein
MLTRLHPFYLVVVSGLVPVSCLAQNLLLGVTAGSNLTRDFQSIHFPPTFYGSTFASSDSRSLIAGPTLEVKWGYGFSAEVNALHRLLKFTDAAVQPGGSKVDLSHFSVATWEFPVLAKYQFPRPNPGPFLEMGASFRAVSNPNGSSPSNHGVTVGAGITLRAGGAKVAPTLRYTRWAKDQFKLGQTGGFNSPARPTVNDQLELLMNVSYDTTERSRRALGRKLWLGVVGGVGLTGDFGRAGPTSLFGTPGGNVIPIEPDRSGARSYPVGVALELEFTDRWSIEGNGLYRRLHFSGLSDVVLTWEVPVLLKYQLPAHTVTPYLAVGPSFRVAGNLNDANPSHYGVTAEAGISRKAGPIQFGPALRYTHWAPDKAPGYLSQSAGTVAITPCSNGVCSLPLLPSNSFSRTVPNQLALLVSVTF